MKGSGFRVQGSGFRVQGSGFRVQGRRLRVEGVFWISSKCFTASHNYENFANLKRTIWKHVIKYGQENRSFLKDLIPCLHFSENFKNLENSGGVKLKHLLEIQNMIQGSEFR